ncbi:MAG TPA: hypothetical protein VFR37_00170 [Longimicrobium sp.]|nr:hypothetical protein [Longimicrobium sp.]
MKKLRLDLDGLQVETFATAHVEVAERGTVHGLNHTREIYCTKGDTCRTSCGGGQVECTCPLPP